MEDLYITEFTFELNVINYLIKGYMCLRLFGNITTFVRLLGIPSCNSFMTLFFVEFLPQKF